MDPLGALNPQQKEAATYANGPSLVVAGPGSGKTRVLTHKISYLIKELKTPPEAILAVTFTNKAADEMRERITRLLGNQVTREEPAFPAAQLPNYPVTELPTWIGTFHSICAKILRVDGNAIGIPPGFLIYDESDQKDLLKNILEEVGIVGEKFAPASILNAISSAKNEMIDAQEYASLAEGYFQETVAQIYPRYQEELRKAQAMDFDDLLGEAVRLFKNKPDVLKRWQNRFRHVLVDEYQDTNHAQYLFVQLLSQEHQNLTVVGDMSQAIYSWRGADFRNILRFEKDYPKAKIFRLAQNYRSTKSILLAARALIEHNRTHLPLELWTENEIGTPIVLYAAENELEEAFSISAQITAMLSDGRAKNYHDFSVLYRTNAQSRVLEEVFIRGGIPYILVGGVKFYERKEIKDVLAYLRLIHNPKDRVSLQRAEKIGKRRLLKFFEVGKEENFLSLSPVEILDKILEQTGYLKYLEDGTKVGEERIENVKELRSVASEFGTLAEFLEHVALVDNSGPRTNTHAGIARYGEAMPSNSHPNPRGFVTLMTLHSAKGLEFPFVFITGLEEGLLPHSRSLTNQEELEEERRLLYVGMTRAQKELHLCFARERLFFGSRAISTPSRFLQEIGEEHFIHHLPTSAGLAEDFA
ncbi:hypothetical protein A2797_02270 [candidate division WWE3 bacterium RIFCSPHIGHO2_01_FULL_48_15]|uniref:DNA 3'-5' helicase n=1 Tax=candidate division WWE3 bacterium RIFCSPHIGHO2_01_FULL_48_15 TaxID=1802619 RepID=A0A1F4VBS8_UNCKA|nr:MAG: hypothetical protein A2797_02270 [candidate division WWE3 bacterium RIFCSPHIGHO2_01_FULL_48_15]